MPQPEPGHPESTTSVLAIEGLEKTYRHGVRANNGLTLSAEAGQVYGVLGHNGAGKTTLVNQIVGLLKPDAGSTFPVTLGSLVILTNWRVGSFGVTAWS